MTKTRSPHAVRSARTPFALMLALGLAMSACGDDDGGGDKPDGDDDKGTRDTGTKPGDLLPDGGSKSMDATAGKPDARAPRDASEETIYIDAGDGGAPIQFTRTDGCPADAPLPVDRVRIYTINGGGAKLVGGKFQGSNEGTTSGFVDLATLATAPKDGEYTELKFTNDVKYRYIRFFDSKATQADIAELEFFHGPVKVVGNAYGTATAGAGDQPVANAFDGKLDTYYRGSTPGGNYLGYDIASSYVAAAPTFTPPGGAQPGATNVELASATPGAEIRYTTDGSNPTSTTGEMYSAPVAFTEGRVSIRAQATAPCYFASSVASANYGIGVEPVPVGQKSYHLGNSLTDQMNPWLEVIADSTGVDHTYARSTIAGSPIGYLWEFRNDPAQVEGTPAVQAEMFDSFVNAFAPIDHLSVQPFSDPEFKSQVPAAANFAKAAQASSPNVQVWVYAQWPSQFPNRFEGTFGYLEDLFARGAPNAGWPLPTTPVPGTWEDTADAQLKYHEAFAEKLDAEIPGKPVLICPCGASLAALKRRVDAGQVPGMTNFFSSIMTDYLHLSEVGGYLVSLTFYSCMYRQTPEGRVTVKPDGLTQEQATLFQQIAWQTASGYPRSGITQ